MKKTLKFGIFSLLLSTNLVHAGSQIVMQDSNSNASGKEKTMLSVEGSMLRIDNQGEQDGLMIFDEKKQEMLIIDHRERSYTRLNKQSLDKINQKMRQARQQMEEQMAKMPPEQRAMMQQMMGDKMNFMSQPQKPQTEVKQTSRTDKAAGYSCQVMEYLVNGEKVRELCVTPLDKIEGAKVIYQSMMGMSRMFQSFIESMSQSFPMMTESNPFAELEKLEGFPIVISEIKNGQVVEKSELKSITTKSFKSDFFQVPKGYKENKMDFGGF